MLKPRNQNTINKKDEEFYSMSEIKVDQLGHKSELERGLQSRHITMISLGGTIGTGLF